MTKLQNLDAERQLIACALEDVENSVPEAKSMGIVASDFFIKQHQDVWEAIEKLYEAEHTVSKPTLKSELEKMGAWDKDTSTALDILYKTDILEFNPETWTTLVMEETIRRTLAGVGTQALYAARDREQDPQDKIDELQLELDSLSDRIIQLRSPVVLNPAEELRRAQGWHIRPGVPFLDRMLRYPSQQLHFIAGDPGAGKSTIGIQMTTFNLNAGYPATVIIAEGDTLDVTLSMLMQLQHPNIDSYFVQRLRNDESFRTEENLRYISEMWDQYYGNLPLRIRKTTRGINEVVSIIAATTDPSLIVVDHAYAVVVQSEIPAGFREHQMFAQLFARSLRGTERNNHVAIMFNQFKLEGRSGAERGPDAQYGGSIVRNIASSVVHVWPVESDYISTSSGYRYIKAKCWKIRSMLLADQMGFPVNPYGQEEEFWIQDQFRKIVAEIPMA